MPKCEVCGKIIAEEALADPVSDIGLPPYKELRKIDEAQDIYFEQYIMPILLAPKSQDKVFQNHPE